MKLALISIAISLIIPSQVQAETPQMAQRINCNNPSGTGYSAFLSECLQRVTEQRIDDIQRALSDRSITNSKTEILTS